MTRSGGWSFMNSGKTTMRTGGWFVLAAGVLWGTTGTAQAFAPDGSQPYTIGASRLLIAGVALIPYALARKELPSSQRWPMLPTIAAALGIASYQPLFGLGVATTLANPFWYVWWVTVAAGFLAQAEAIGIATLAAFYVGHISADYAWDTFLSASASAGRRVLTNRRYQALIFVTGGFMIYLGIRFFASALNNWI